MTVSSLMGCLRSYRVERRRKSFHNSVTGDTPEMQSDFKSVKSVNHEIGTHVSML